MIPILCRDKAAAKIYPERLPGHPLDLRHTVPEFLTAIGESCPCVIVDVDLRNAGMIAQLKAGANSIKKARERIFVVERGNRAANVQAVSLGATRVITRPIEKGALEALIGGSSIKVEAPTAKTGTPASFKPTKQAKRLQIDVPATRFRPVMKRPILSDEMGSNPVVAAMQSGAAALTGLFEAVRRNEPVNDRLSAKAAADIIDATHETQAADFLNLVRDHHTSTYQHCLLVTAVATIFGRLLGLGDKDLKTLSLCALYHDVGKAMIPVEILDKPGSLTPEEFEIVKRHPRLGHDFLRKNPNMSPMVLEAALRHHEFLDGTGYPDGLKGNEIPDIVRIITITDIFGALIEDRSYRPAMPGYQAFALLKDMADAGKLEPALVSAFKPVALVV